MITFTYYLRRLLPFAFVCFLYEVLEVLTQMYLEQETIATLADVSFLLLEMLSSFCFLVLPVCLYLLMLPHAYHGSRYDKLLSLLLFVAFCLANGVEELAEVLSHDELSMLTARLLQSPAEVWADFSGLPGMWWGSAVMVALVAATACLLRPKLVVLPPSGVPSAFGRAMVPLLLSGAGYMFSGCVEGVLSVREVPEMYREGMVSMFGSLFRFTALPNLYKVFDGPVLFCCDVVLVVGFAELCWRQFMPSFRSPAVRVSALLSRLTARYGMLRMGLAGALLLWLVVRLWSLGLYPLMDTTEARYAEMARKMVETGNWLQPQFDYGVPFWGKPPLSFWCSALCIRLFGATDWAPRIAPFLATVGMAALFFCWPQRGERTDKGLAAALLFLASAIGFVSAGAVMTDAFLSFGMMLALLGFYRAMTDEAPARLWGYLFFIGLAVGLLSKGPLTLVLCGAPLFLWCCMAKAWGRLWHRLPWVSGSVLALIPVIAWYAAAEAATPGFLRYFIIGEHVERFLVKGWEGDLYGNGHSCAIGTIWLFAMEMLLPWALLLPFLIRRSCAAQKTAPCADDRAESLYLWLWALCPLLFFTVARNILPAYVLPAMPAMVLLLVRALWRRSEPARRVVFLCVPVFAVMIMFGAGCGFDFIEYRCQKELLQNVPAEAEVFYCDDKPPYSAQYYRSGRVSVPPEGAALDALPSGVYVAAREKTPQLTELVESPHWQPVADSHKWQLFRKK